MFSFRYFTEVLAKSDRDVSEIELFESGDWVRVADKDDSDDSDSSSPRPRCESSRASTASTDVRVNSTSGKFLNNEISKMTSNVVVFLLTADTLVNSKALSSRNFNKNSSSSPVRTSSLSANAAEPNTCSKDNSAEVVIDLTEESDDETTVTTNNQSPSSVKLRASSLSQSCSTSPSESIIVLDSPPSRPNMTPDDPVESFIRASHNIVNSPSLPTTSTTASTSANHYRNSSPPKKRFKPVSPLVNAAAAAAASSSTATPSSSSIYNSLSQTLTTSLTNQVSRSNSVNCTPNLPTAIDYSTSAAYNAYRQNYYQTPTYGQSQSPILKSSPYNNGTDVSSSTPSMMMPHSAPPLANGTSFFAPQPPPPLHYGPSQAAIQQQANYLNSMLGFGQQHRLPSVLHNSYGVDHQASNNLGDYFPLLDSRVQAEYQKFLNSYMNETNGTS